MLNFTPLSTYGQTVRSLTVRHNHTVTLPLILLLETQHLARPRCQYECRGQGDQKVPSLCTWAPAAQVPWRGTSLWGRLHIPSRGTSTPHVKANFSTGITEQWGRAIIPHICFLYIPNLFCFGICVRQGTFTFLKATSCYTHQRIYLFFNLGLFQAYEGRVACISYSSWTQVWVIFPHFSPFTQFINLDTRYPAYTILLSESSCLFFSSLLENSGSLWLLWSFMYYDKMHYLLKKEKKGSEVTAVTYR